jgi:hypothetical protein
MITSTEFGNLTIGDQFLYEYYGGLKLFTVTVRPTNPHRTQALFDGYGKELYAKDEDGCIRGFYDFQKKYIIFKPEVSDIVIEYDRRIEE